MGNNDVCIHVTPPASGIVVATPASWDQTKSTESAASRSISPTCEAHKSAVMHHNFDTSRTCLRQSKCALQNDSLLII